MKPEELLKPRYKVTADYPEMECKIGDIFHKLTFDNGNYTYVTNPGSPLQGYIIGHMIERMPHIFKPLEWWEDRKPEDMPEYVKSIKQEYGYGVKVGKIIKVKEWVLLSETMYVIQSTNREFHPSCFLPATREEYKANQKTQT